MKEDGNQNIIPELQAEREAMDPAFMPHAIRLLDQAIEELQEGKNSQTPAGSKDESKYTEVTKEKPIRVQVKVAVPVKEHPRFNFVGKLLGPKGNSMKRLQEETLTKMAILGRGSMRDKNKEEEMRQTSDPKYAHLNDELHVEVNAYAPPAEAYARVSHALAELKKFLIPDNNDEIRQVQLQELNYFNGGNPAPGGPGPSGGRGRGGGMMPRPPPINSSGLAPRALTSRPGAVPRLSRPLLTPSRGGPARGAMASSTRMSAYRGSMAADDGYGNYNDGYDYQETYNQDDGQYYDYGSGGAGTAEEYEEDYGVGDRYAAVTEDWRPTASEAAPRLKAPPSISSSRPSYREHPYAPQMSRF